MELLLTEKSFLTQENTFFLPGALVSNEWSTRGCKGLTPLPQGRMILKPLKAPDPIVESANTSGTVASSLTFLSIQFCTPHCLTGPVPEGILHTSCMKIAEPGFWRT